MQGGTRSGKTFSVIYWLIWFCDKYKNAGIEIDIVRDTFTALKATAWKDFESVLLQHGLYDERSHNKTDKQYILNGNTISYYGADTPDKIHGRSRDILWINESHQFPERTVDQLFPRTRHKIICDYNPALGSEHWLDKYIEQYGCLITTYKDNPHLTPAQIEDIESRKDNPYWWAVYGSGNRAAVEGVIFENWAEGAFDESLACCFGLDYGFFPDPLALVQVAVNRKARKLYLREKIYSTKLSTDDLKNDFSKALPDKRSLIVSDTNEARTNVELQKAGFNIVKAAKGANSIVDDIREMQDYEIIVDPESYNIKRELNNYAWNDKKASIPIDAFNHSLDAARYGFRRLVGPKKPGVRRRN